MKKRKLYLSYITICLLPLFLHGNDKGSFATLEEEYPPKYCLQLEAAYGKGMMSEGGINAIEHMFDFDSTCLEKKTILDIGSGLGGNAFYLAEKYSAQVTGLDVNPWMIEESKRRTPEFLKDKINFLLSTSNSGWPLSKDSYDMIYSKGVLTHLDTKDEIFQECHRLLRKKGVLVITDWLSAHQKKWGKNIARLVELEHLSLFPENEEGYIETLKKNGFNILSVRDDSFVYLKYNQEIIDRLRDPNQHPFLLNYFDEQGIEDAIEGYESIVKAIETGELRVVRFVSQKE